jgi:gliding motility-associated-like protein
MKKILFFCYCISLSCFAQKEAYQWVFPVNNGYNFNTNTLFQSNINQFEPLNRGFEGCASIADAQGNLLFYTGAGKVWNREHQVMMNGDDLMGSFTTTQTIIVPQPNSSRYYIFTNSPQVDAFEELLSIETGFHYSVVDMSLAGGLGAVVEKNVLLFRNTTEKVTATKHGNGTDYWVLAHEWGNNHFRAYLIAQEGLNAESIISRVGSTHFSDNSKSPNSPKNLNAIGQMKISPNGNMVALAIFGNRVVNDGRIIDIGYFNKWTGRVSNIQSNTFPIEFGDIYGIEFSSNNQVLYFTSSSLGLFQLNLKNIDFFQNITNINTNINSYQLQLSPKEQIFLVDQIGKYLSIIRNPNKIGLECDFEYNGIFLEDGRSGTGLPNFVSSFLPNEDPDFRFPSVEAYLEMPNAFTPNGDGKNDAFVPIVSENITASVFTIYNRWGQVVFTNNKEIAWSGENHPVGLYYYHITYTGKDNNTQEAKGWVQLLR